MTIKTTKSEKKVTIRKTSKRDAAELVLKEKSCPDVYPKPEDELVVLVVPDEPLAEEPVVEEQPVKEQPVEEQPVLEEQPVEVSAELVSSSDEELLEKPKKTRVLKEGKLLVNDVGEYLNPLTNRYVKVGTTLYKKLIKDGMICVVPV